MMDPLALFRSLDKSKSNIKKLRGAQEETLEIYYNKLKDYPRIGIKLPTGSGKSLIAILVLESWRQAGKVVAILAANKALAKDMKKRCDELGIPSDTIFGSSDPEESKALRMMKLLNYKQKRIIGIFNYHAFLYGTEYNQEIFPPDLLVIDDASDFAILRNQFFSITLDRKTHPNAYQSILSRLIEETNLYPNLNSFLNNSGGPNDVELIYFSHYPCVLSELDKELNILRKDSNFMFQYDRNKDFINSLLIFISQYDIELRPLMIPEESLTMGNIKQIIFMSATLPKDDLLNRIFGIRKTPAKIIDEKSISHEAYEEITTLGKRIVFPLEETDLKSGLGDKCKNIILGLVNTHKKLLVLVNSNVDADALNKFLIANDVNAMLFSNENYEKFAYSTAEGVLIGANRYFGLDFPGGSCKVEVIGRLPFVWDNVDAFQYSVLNNTNYVEQTVGYRLTQSLGRCNRLLTDEGLYYILDSRIIARITGKEQYLRYLPANMYAELMAGYFLSEGGDITKALDYGSSSFFGKKDKMYEEIIKSQKTMHETPPELDSKYDLEIEGWVKSLTRSFATAGSLFDLVGNFYRENISDVKEQNLKLLAAFNFYLSAMNYYNAFNLYGKADDRQSTLHALTASIENGENSSWFNGLRVIFNQLSDSEKMPFDENVVRILKVKEEISDRFDYFIDSNSSKNKNWRDAYSQMKKDVNEGTHSQTIDSLILFLGLLGFRSSKGDNKKGEPDVFAESDQYRLAIEVKTKERGEIESVDNVREAMGYRGVVERRTPRLSTYAILLTQKEEFSPTALEIAIDQVRLIPTSIFSVIIDKVYHRIDEISNMSPVERSPFVKTLISPYELEKIFAHSHKNPLNMSELNI